MGAALFVLAGLAAYLASPRLAVVGALLGFLFQELLVAVAGGRETALGAAAMQLDEGLLVGLAVAAVGTALATGRRLRFGAWFPSWLLYVFAALCSIALQHSGWARGILGILLVSKGFAYAFAVQQVDWEAGDERLWLRALLVSLSVILVFAIPDLVAPVAFRTAVGFPPTVDERSGLASVVSLLGHPGGYGYVMGVGALIGLGTLLVTRAGRAALVALVFFAGALLSLRRKAILGPIAAAVVVAGVLARQVDRRIVVATLTVLGIVFVPLAAVVMPIFIEGARGYFSADALTYQARTALYAGSVLLARQHLPFGAGVGRYGSAGSVSDYSDIYYEFGFNLIYGMSPTYTEFIMDTFWPQVLGETGVIGLVGYAAALIAMLRAALARARTSADARLLPLRVITPMVAVYTMLESLAAPTYGVAFPAALSCGLLALSTADWAPARTPVASPSSVPAHA